mgnify:FL=1
MSYNLPSDWHEHWQYCSYHQHRYHASEGWCRYCEEEDEEESSEEESSEEESSDDDDDCDILCFCRECLN